MRLFVVDRFVNLMQPRVIGIDRILDPFAIPSPLMLAVVTNEVWRTVNYLATTKNYTAFFDVPLKFVVKCRHALHYTGDATRPAFWTVDGFTIICHD